MRRQQKAIVAKALIVGLVATSGIVALVSGRLWWRNYWGGMVFAPVAVAIVALIIAAELITRRKEKSRRRR